MQSKEAMEDLRMDLRVGIIGCGMIGKEHAKRLQYKIQGVTVTAVCDVLKKVQKQHQSWSEESEYIRMLPN